MNTAPVPSTAVYVYCVAPAASFASEGEHFSSPAIGGSGEPVRTVQYEDLVAVVSDSPNIRYTLRREYLDAHQRVLAEALARSDILPLSFGSVAKNDHQVREVLLKRQFDDLHRHLGDVRERLELDVRVFWEQEELFGEIVAEYDSIRELRETLAGSDPDATHFARIELGEMTEAAMREKSEEEAARILERLEPLAAETKINPEQTEAMVLNAAFLVDKQRKGEFDAAVQALTENSQGRLIVQYVGPVAPYNFVTLHVAWNG
jgi:gas vesicle protein GvpL/GvpF